MFTIVRRHPLVAFFSLTYLFLLLGWLVFRGQVPFGPLLAALVVVPIIGGRAGLKHWAKRITHWRVGLRWYAAAIILPVIITGGAALLNILLGASYSTDQLGNWPELIPEFIFLLLFVGLGEEPGFRGFALPRLQAHYSAVVATLILGVLGVLWHVPLFLTGDSPWSNVPLILAAYFVFTWFFNNTNGSVLIVMLFHSVTAVIGPLFFATLFSDNDLATYTWLLTALYGLVAVYVIVTDRSSYLSRKPSEQLTDIIEPTPVPLPVA